MWVSEAWRVKSIQYFMRKKNQLKCFSSFFLKSSWDTLHNILSSSWKMIRSMIKSARYTWFFHQYLWHGMFWMSAKLTNYLPRCSDELGITINTLCHNKAEFSVYSTCNTLLHNLLCTYKYVFPFSLYHKSYFLLQTCSRLVTSHETAAIALPG